MGLPAFFLGFAIPIITAIGFIFYMERSIEHHRQHTEPRRQTPNWNISEPGEAENNCKNKNKSGAADNCSICMDPLTSDYSKPFKCRHGFHSKCLVDYWSSVKGVSVCPNCRAETC